MNLLILIPIIIGSLTISTVLIALYIRKYNSPEAITAVYVIYLALSQILALKIADFTIVQAPAAVVIFPFVFQLTDTVNEHFGKKATYRMIFIGFITQVLMIFFIIIGNQVDPSFLWFINDEDFLNSTIFTPDLAWGKFFGPSIGIITGSWVAFLVSNYFDSWFYDWVKSKTKEKALWIRSLVTDIPSLALDSCIFVTIAFGLFGGLWVIVGELILGQLIMKWILGVVDTPFLYLDRWIVNYKRKSNEE
ncbi:MAG: queuosine precursor transporter [Promethearchaeota archaeon]